MFENQAFIDYKTEFNPSLNKKHTLLCLSLKHEDAKSDSAFCLMVIEKAREAASHQFYTASWYRKVTAIEFN